MNAFYRYLCSLIAVGFVATSYANAEPAGDLNLSGRAALVARDGHDLILGNEGDDDVVFIQNNAESFRIDGATNTPVFSTFSTSGAATFQSTIEVAGIATFNAAACVADAEDNEPLRLGTCTAFDADVANIAPLQIVHDTSGAPGAQLCEYGANNNGVGIEFYKTRSASATCDANTIIAVNNDIGALRFYGSDGAAFIQGAEILVEVDAAPGLNDLPTAMDFKVTLDGAAAPTSALRLANSKLATFGGGVLLSAAADITLAASGTLALQEATVGTKCMGTATATGTAAVVIATTCAVTGSRIFLTRSSAPSGTAQCWYDNIVNGSSFNLDCDGAETGTFSWMIVHESAG